MGNARLGGNRPRTAVVKTQAIFRAAAMPIMRSRYVSAAHQTQEGRQGAPLLERSGELPDRRGPCGAAAAAVPGRDQRFARIGLAQVDRRAGRRGGRAAHAIAVCGGPLRGAAAGRLDRPLAAERAAAMPTAPMGRMLAGAELVARAGARSVLGRAAAPEPQRHAVGSGAVAAGDLPTSGARQRVAIASPMVRAQRHGRPARRGSGAGRDPQAVSLS